MFQITPAELRNVLTEVRNYNVAVSHQMEFREAVISNAPFHIRGALLSEFEYIRDAVRQVLRNVRYNIGTLEKILQEDEVANGWQGDNRYINFFQSEDEYRNDDKYVDEEGDPYYPDPVEYQDQDQDAYKDFNADEDDDDEDLWRDDPRFQH
jgi:hypothetical protein